PRAWNEFREIRFSIRGRRIARSLLGDRKAQRKQPGVGLDRARRPVGRQAATARVRPDLDRARSQPWPRWKGRDGIRRRPATGEFEVAARGVICVRRRPANLPPRSPNQAEPGCPTRRRAGRAGPGKASCPARGRRVLIVEDEAMIAGLIETILSAAGWSVVG